MSTAPSAHPPTAISTLVPITASAPGPLSRADLERLYPSSLQLRLVQYIHRHGERSPVWPGLQHLIPPVQYDCHLGSFFALDVANGGQLYRKSVVNAATWMPGVPDQHVHTAAHPEACYHGQLTDRGRSTLAGLGSYLRDLYATKLKFLPETMSSPDFIYLRSTDYPRTIESLHSLVSNLYPPLARSLPTHEPLHIFTRSPAGFDNAYPDVECSRYVSLRKQFTSVIRHQISKESEKWPAKVRDILDPKYGPVLAFDVLASSVAHGKPVNVTPEEFELLRDSSTRFWFEHMTAYPILPRLMIGRFMTELAELQQHVVTGTIPSKVEFSMHLQHMVETKANAPPKLALYSAHDTSIVPILGALGLWNGQNRRWPMFASHITIETLKDNTVGPTTDPKSSHYVRVKYNDIPQLLPACQGAGDHHPADKSLCTYRAFETLVSEVSASRQEHNQLCQPISV